MKGFRILESGFVLISSRSLSLHPIPGPPVAQARTLETRGLRLQDSCQAVLVPCCENWIAFTDCLDFSKLTFTYGKCPAGGFSTYSVNTAREKYKLEQKAMFKL